MAPSLLVSIALLQEGAKIGKELVQIWKDFVHGSPSKTGARIRQHNMFIGKPNPDDIVFVNYYRDVPGKLMQHQSEEISWSAKVLGEGLTGIVTSVSVIDCWLDGTGGMPELVDGGIGQDHVKVRFTSKFSRGYAVRVIITGVIKEQSDNQQSSSLTIV